MRTNIFFLLLCCSILLNCSKNTTTNTWAIGEGVEIFLTKTPKTNDYTIDYSKLNIDTFALQAFPILKYNDVKCYKKSSHTLILNINSEEVDADIKSVYGRMFIMTIDKKPIYCGFMWPLTSSAICSHVFILEKLAGPEGNKNEMQINFTNLDVPDPRSDSRIMDRLKLDNKLID